MWPKRMFYLRSDLWFLVHYNAKGEIIGIDETDFGPHLRSRGFVGWANLFVSLVVSRTTERCEQERIHIKESAKSFLVDIAVEYWPCEYSGDQ